MSAPDRGKTLSKGKKFRRNAGRVEICEWNPSRRRDPLAILRAIARTRIRSLQFIKVERMSASPFGYFRGSAAVMAFDLSQMPNSGINVQICGDAHLSNLGSYAGPEGTIVFDINDFDETIVAPWEWDIKRMAVSIMLAGKESGHKTESCATEVLRFANIYRRVMHELASLTALELHRYRVHRHLKSIPLQSILRKAERATPQESMRKLVQRKNGEWRFIELRPLLFRVTKQERRQVLASLASYRETLSPESQHLFDCYHPVDVSFKVVGTGSVGVRDYVVLLFGRDEGDPLFLQIKEEPPSCYAPYLPDSAAVGHQGRRVVTGEKMMQVQSDFLLGWTSISGREFLVRQLNDHKASIGIEDLQGNELGDYSALCAEVFAKAHARAGDPGLIAGYLGTSTKFDEALAKFAVAYAKQVESDYERFLASHRRPASKAPAKKSVRSNGRR